MIARPQAYQFTPYPGPNPHLGCTAQDLLQSKGGGSYVPLGFVLFGLVDAIPIPTDIAYFYVQKWLVENKDRLSPTRFWVYQTLNYYGWNFAFYVMLGGVTAMAGRTVSDKLRYGLGFLSAAALATILWRFAKGAPTKAAMTQAPSAAAPTQDPFLRA